MSGGTDGTPVKPAALRSRNSNPNNRAQRQLETVGRQPRAQLVSFEGGKFVMDPSGKRLKRLSSSNYLRHSASVSDMGSATSAKRLLARYMSSKCNPLGLHRVKLLGNSVCIVVLFAEAKPMCGMLGRGKNRKRNSNTANFSIDLVSSIVCIH